MTVAATRRPVVGVIGSGSPLTTAVATVAEELGRLIREAGYDLVCGGLGGVMEAACRGAARAAGPGRIIAILPSASKKDANPYADLVLPSGLGIARNALVVLASDALVALDGGSGTLSEIAMAWQLERPVCFLTGLPGVVAELAGRSLDDRHPGKILSAADPAAALEALRPWLRGQVI